MYRLSYAGSFIFQININVPALCQASQWPSSQIFQQENSVQVSSPPPSIYSVAFKNEKVDKKCRLVLSWHRNLRTLWNLQPSDLGSRQLLPPLFRRSEGQFILKWCILFICDPYCFCPFSRYNWPRYRAFIPSHRDSYLLRFTYHQVCYLDLKSRLQSGLHLSLLHCEHNGKTISQWMSKIRCQCGLD